MPLKQQVYLALLLAFFALLGLAAQFMFKFDPGDLTLVSGTLKSHKEVTRTETVKGKDKKRDETKTHKHVEVTINEKDMRVRIDDGLFPKKEDYGTFLAALNAAAPGTAVTFHLKAKDAANPPTGESLDTPPRLSPETLTLGTVTYASLDDRAAHYSKVRRNAAYLGIFCGVFLIPVIIRIVYTRKKNKAAAMQPA